MSTPATPVLMSADNPSGWKLEDLLAQLQVELDAKIARIRMDVSPTATAVMTNNFGIRDHLARAEVLQRDTLRRLDALRADPGPGGPPRIGASAPREA